MVQLYSDQVLIDGKLVPALLTLGSNGKISSIEQGEAASSKADAAGVSNVSGKMILPGVVDTHVHVNEPGRTAWEGFETATRAAAAGGVTALFDMPLNSIPPTTTVANLDEKTAAAHGKVAIDVGFIGGVIPKHQQHIKPLVNAGVIGFKCFMVFSGVDEFPHVEEADIREALEQIKDTDAFLMFHAEVDHEDIPKEPVGPSSSYSTFLASRPRAMENDAIDTVIRLCGEYKVRCHIVHLSSSDALDPIRKAKENGVPLTVETCYHYLFWAADEVPDKATQFKCCPPVREKENRELLWQGLLDGAIDMVVSDHSPSTPDLKLLEDGDFMGAWGGIASLQFGLPILRTCCFARGIDVPQMMQWVTTRTAALAKVDDRKGKIAVGYDADVIVFDADATRTVALSDIFFKNKVTPYESQELRGVVHQTYLRGTRIYDLEEGHVDKPMGELINVTVAAKEDK